LANHVRRSIREAIATAVTGLPTTGSRVFQSRVYALERTDLPALLVSSVQERVVDQSIGYPRLYERVVTISVTAIAAATADLDDTLDQICKEVETALGTQGVALGGGKVATLQSTSLYLISETEKPVGQAVMSYDVFYMTAENAPDVAL
jgi:hypothetical protein